MDRDGQPVDLTVTLPPRWWWTDLRFRQSSVEPRPDFEDRPLTEAEKRSCGLKPDGFASQVKYVAEFAKMMKTSRAEGGRHHRRGGRRGQRRIRQYRRVLHQAAQDAGDSVTLDVLRDGQRIKMPLKTFRIEFPQMMKLHVLAALCLLSAAPAAGRPRSKCVTTTISPSPTRPAWTATTW